MNAKMRQPIGLWQCDTEPATLPLSHKPVWTNNSDSVDLSEHLFAMVDSAKRSLWIASPFIDDHRIVEALIRAKTRRVRIKVITDIRNNRGRGKQYITRGFESTSQEETELEAHQACIRELSRALISCRSPMHYPHFKLIIADEQSALLSSANLTENSLGGNSGSSLEVGLSIDRNDQVEGLLKVLSCLWDTCPFRLILNGADVSIEQQGSEECIALIARMVSAAGLLANSPGEEFFSLTEAIIKGINTSKFELTIASMSFFEVNRAPGLEEALLAALRREVRVTAIIRLEHFRKEVENGKYPDASTRKLIEAGMKLVGIAGMHAKGLLVDQYEGIVFSANINPYSLTSELESNHIELGIKLLKVDSCFDGFALFMNELRRASTHHFMLTQ